MSISSDAHLLDALRNYRLLDPSQLENAKRALHGKSSDLRTVLDELLRQGLITPYQFDLLGQGRLAELVLGEYVLLEPLGEGGMGKVFKARHLTMNRIVALKIIRQDQLSHSEAVERFRREIQAAAQLDSPYLVRAYDASQVGGTHFLVMEYAEGSDLQQLVQKSGPLPVANACVFIRQAALGLQHAWERGLVHRDIKPSNLQLTAQGSAVKILDMGLARVIAGEVGNAGQPGLTQVRTLLGTPDYIAPEQIAEASRVGIQADIYSLGCTFYFLLAGRPPFASVPTWQEKLVSHIKTMPRPIEEIRPEVPPPIIGILKKMMAKQPLFRYSDPAAVAAALAPYCQTAEPLSDSAAVQNSRLISQPTLYQAGSLPPMASTVTAQRAPTMKVPPPPPPPPPRYDKTTVIIPQPPLPTNQTVPPRRRRPWTLFAAGGVVLGLLILLPILLWPKESEKGNKKTDPAKPFIDEDFRDALAKGQTRPTGWKGDDFRVTKEKTTNDPCLEVSLVDGYHFVELPPVSLTGDFYIEGVYLLWFREHVMTIRLDARNSNAVLPVSIQAEGYLTVGDKRVSPPANYRAGQPNKFLITRKGKTLKVTLNNDSVYERDLEGIAEYGTVKIGLPAGGGDHHARLYRLKIGPLSE